MSKEPTIHDKGDARRQRVRNCEMQIRLSLNRSQRQEHLAQHLSSYHWRQITNKFWPRRNDFEASGSNLNETNALANQEVMDVDQDHAQLSQHGRQNIMSLISLRRLARSTGPQSEFHIAMQFNPQCK